MSDLTSSLHCSNLGGKGLVVQDQFLQSGWKTNTGMLVYSASSTHYSHAHSVLVCVCVFLTSVLFSPEALGAGHLHHPGEPRADREHAVGRAVSFRAERTCYKSMSYHGSRLYFHSCKHGSFLCHLWGHRWHSGTVASQQEGRGFKSRMVQHVRGLFPGLSVWSLHVLPVFTRVPPHRTPTIKTCKKSRCSSVLTLTKSGPSTWTWSPGAASLAAHCSWLSLGEDARMGKSREHLPPSSHLHVCVCVCVSPPICV